MNNWNLDVLYKDTNDQGFKDDYASLLLSIDELKESTKNLRDCDTNSSLCSLIEQLKSFTSLSNKIGAYLTLRLSVDTTNQEITSMNDRFNNDMSETAKPFAAITLWIKDLDFNKIDFNNPLLNEHKFWLNEIKDTGKYTLDQQSEEVVSKLTLNASNNWTSLQQYLTSTLVVEMDGEEYTLPSIRNMAYSGEPNKRKKAYEAELKAYDKIKDSIAFALNSIKGEAITVSKLRGYDSIVDMTLISSRMSKETLNAMLDAIKESLPHFHKYLKHKSSLLGHKNGLPFYDLFAPLGSSDKKFTVEESRDYLIKNFDSFSKDVSNIVREAYDSDWIDFFPRKGKVGGAFCFNLPMIKQSRVLTNFDGSLSDVITLAHELGHAYHGYCIQDHSPLNTEYSMPVAETASIFNETIVMNDAIKNSTSKDEQILLIESSLQDSTQVIIDILSRYTFETNIITARENEFMFANDFEKMMTDAQKYAYGDGLDPNYLHPYMWVNKGHYYSAGLNFYNFPYAFGLLFAKGLYAKYQKEGDSFLPKYKELLYSTTVSSVEDVAKIADIDLTDKSFWKSSLDIIIAQIDEFIEITKE